MTDQRGTVPPEIGGTVRNVLAAYAAGTGEGCGRDAGPPVLAALAVRTAVTSGDLGRRVLTRWLDELPEAIGSVGAFGGGLGGFHAALRAGRLLHPDLSTLERLAFDHTPRWTTAAGWRSRDVAWRDYDLFHGPAGLVLAGTTHDTPVGPFAPAVRQLAGLCDRPDLERLRGGSEIDAHSSFNVGRVNTGLGHGVAGVAAALRHAVETRPDAAAYRPALGRACGWLTAQAYLAAGGLITWPRVGRDGPAGSPAAGHVQAWCYGTPGVAWVLWEAGRVLDDTSLTILGEEAMRSFCRVFEEDRHLHHGDPGEDLAVCHGAAGTLAVADAFARHAGLVEAATLRGRLDRYLRDRVGRLPALASAEPTMLNGATGVLAVLLSVHGAPRGWLSQLALR